MAKVRIAPSNPICTIPTIRPPTAVTILARRIASQNANELAKMVICISQ